MIAAALWKLREQLRASTVDSPALKHAPGSPAAARKRPGRPQKRPSPEFDSDSDAAPKQAHGGPPGEKPGRLRKRRSPELDSETDTEMELMLARSRSGIRRQARAAAAAEAKAAADGQAKPPAAAADLVAAKAQQVNRATGDGTGAEPDSQAAEAAAATASAGNVSNKVAAKSRAAGMRSSPRRRTRAAAELLAAAVPADANTHKANGTLSNGAVAEAGSDAAAAFGKHMAAESPQVSTDVDVGNAEDAQLPSSSHRAWKDNGRPVSQIT